jgi:hypothetical protein
MESSILDLRGAFIQQFKKVEKFKINNCVYSVLYDEQTNGLGISSENIGLMNWQFYKKLW